MIPLSQSASVCRCARSAARVLLALVVVLAIHAQAAAPRAYAQAVATVSGIVSDASGAAVPGARIEAFVAGRIAASAAAGPDGRYRLEVPSDTRYQLRAKQDGFAEVVAEMPGASGTVAHDLVLPIGTVSDTVVVTASRGAADRASVTGSISVITAADLAALGAASLGDALRTLPGINVESNGREGALASLFSRGGESDYNLVLIDGVRVNQSGGAFDVSRVMAGDIERVEVVRGAQSALYGSDAIGSVVQIFTRRGASPAGGLRASGAVEGGSFDTWRGTAGIGGGAGAFDVYAGTSLRRTEGAFQDVLPEHDRFEQAAVHVSAGARLGARASVRSGFRYDDANGRSVGPIAYTTGDTGTALDTSAFSWFLDASHSLGARATGTATLAYFRSAIASADRVADALAPVYAILEGTPGARFPDSPRLVRLVSEAEFQALASTGLPPGPGQFLAFTPFGLFDFAPSESRTEFRRPAVRYQADLVWAGGRLSGGYEYERESNPPSGFAIDNHGLFVQQELSWRDRWFVTAGIRLDEKSRYGRFASPRLSGGGFLIPYRRGALSSVKVSSSIGRGIKTPQLAELFGSGFTDGNPALEPERARTVDAGVEATFADQRLRASATWFDNTFRDQVEFRSSGGFGPDGLPDFFNIAGSEAHGLELEAVLQRPLYGFTLGASYTFLQTRVTDTSNTGVQFRPGQPLLRRPRHSGMIRAGYIAGRLTASADVEIRGQRHDSSFLFLRSVPNPAMPQAVTTDITVNPGYAVAGVGVDLRLQRGWTLFVRGDNVTDTKYESTLGYPGLPRAFVAGVRVG